MARNGRQRTVYLVTAAAMLAMIGGYALAATTVTTLSPQQASNVTQTPSPGGFAGIAAVTSEQLVVLSGGMAGSTAAGTETAGAVGLSGAPSALAACATPPCAAVNRITALPATETSGDFGEQIFLSVTQPSGAATNSVGFDMAVTVSITVGAVTSSVNALAYLATGSTGGGSSSSVPVFLFVDLGTTSAPVINSVSVVFNQCSSATTCP
ncbi:MAG TPA: hypothetical protein VEY07_02780 [Thermoplasmata archaeon]|nr:hypothetical protein [Thermoplasmata archaeon]